MKKQQLPLLIAITSLGVSSVVTQITVSRELFSLTGGAELVVGVFVSLWLLLTGLGAFLGMFQHHPRTSLVASLLLSAFLPFGHVLALRYMRNILVVPGASLDPSVLFVLLPILLAPFCLLSGYVLTLATSLLTHDDSEASVGDIYFFDNIGDIIGGALFSFVLVYLFSTLNALFVPAGLCIVSAILVSWQKRQVLFTTVSLLCTVALGVLGSVGVDRTSLEWLFPHQHIAHVKESVYGRIVVTQQDEQFTLFENGIPFASSHDRLSAEEIVHPAMSQVQDSGASVLLVSGGLSGALSEISKHKPGRVDYVELDPEVVSIGKAYAGLSLAEPATVHLGDGRKFVEMAHGDYDAILVDLPPPTNVQINRFYTKEFFEHVHDALRDGGVVSLSLTEISNYVLEEQAALFRSIASAARENFDNVMLLPLGSSILLASDGPLTVGIAEILQRRNIGTHYTNSYYLNAGLSLDRMELADFAIKGGKANEDLRPRAVAAYSKYWRSKFGGSIVWPVMLALVVVGAGLMLMTRRIQAAVFATGYGAISVEVVVLLLFQIHSGYLYVRYGIIVMLFMIGLSAGSFVANRRMKSRPGCRSDFFRIEILLFCLFAAIAAVVGLSDFWRNDFVLYCMVMAVSMLTGAQFPAAVPWTGVGPVKSAARLYTADFVGAGVGAAATSMVLLPMIGVRGTLVVVVLFKALTVARNVFKG